MAARGEAAGGRTFRFCSPDRSESNGRGGEIDGGRFMARFGGSRDD